jgi:hypothetical protein
MNAFYLFHTLTDPLLKCHIREKTEELHVVVKRKLIVREYYTLDSDSDGN